MSTDEGEQVRTVPLELQGDIEGWSEQCAKRHHITFLKCSTYKRLHTYIHTCIAYIYTIL